VLYNFQGGADGANPYAGLIFDAHGALYGAASGGGATGNGTVFKLTPPTTSGGAWADTILHSFTGADGREPYIPLVFDAQGALYGAAYFGGASNQSVVFKLSPPAAPSGKWKYAVLYQFTGKTDGANPMGLIFDKSGTLYGTAAFGAISNWGVVFHLTPPSSGVGAWTETVIHSFTSDGYTPYGGVMFGQMARSTARPSPAAACAQQQRKGFAASSTNCFRRRPGPPCGPSRSCTAFWAITRLPSM